MQAELMPEQIRQITRFLDATTPLPDHADLIFVFGGRSPIPAQHAAALYQQGIAALIVLTGGLNRHLPGLIEAEAHQRILLEQGVPESSIIVENRSSNTYENVSFALPLIAERLPLGQIRQVVGVAKWQHSRRALMTLRAHFPAGVRYFAHTYSVDGIERDNWHLNENEQQAVLKNWQGIPAYLERGHIAEIIRDGTAYI